MKFQNIVKRYEGSLSSFIGDVKNAQVEETFLRGRRIKLPIGEVRYNDLLKAALKIFENQDISDPGFISKMESLALEKAKDSWKTTRAFTWVKSKAALLFYDRDTDIQALKNKSTSLCDFGNKPEELLFPTNMNIVPPGKKEVVIEEKSKTPTNPAGKKRNSLIVDESGKKSSQDSTLEIVKNEDVKSLTEPPGKTFSWESCWLLDLKIKDFKEATHFPVDDLKVQEFIKAEGVNSQALTTTPLSRSVELPLSKSDQEIEFSLDNQKIIKLFSEEEVLEMRKGTISSEDLKDIIKMRMAVLEKYNEILQKNSESMKEALESRVSESYSETDFKSDLFQLLQSAVVIFETGRVGFEDAEVYSTELGAKIFLKTDENGMIENLMIERDPKVISSILQQQEEKLQNQLIVLKEKLLDAESRKELFREWLELSQKEITLLNSINRNRHNIKSAENRLIELRRNKIELQEKKFDFENEQINNHKEILEDLKKDVDFLEKWMNDGIPILKFFKYGQQELELEKLKLQSRIDLLKTSEESEKELIEIFEKNLEKKKKSLKEKSVAVEKEIEKWGKFISEENERMENSEKEMNQISLSKKSQKLHEFDSLKLQPKYFDEEVENLKKDIRDVEWTLKGLGAELREEPIKLGVDIEKFEESAQKWTEEEIRRLKNSGN